LCDAAIAAAAPNEHTTSCFNSKAAHLGGQHFEQSIAELVDSGGGNRAALHRLCHVVHRRFRDGHRFALQQLACAGTCVAGLRRWQIGAGRGVVHIGCAERRGKRDSEARYQKQAGEQEASEQRNARQLPATATLAFKLWQSAGKAVAPVWQVPRPGWLPASPNVCGSSGGGGTRYPWSRALACAVGRLNREQEHACKRERGAHPRHGLVWSGGAVLSSWRGSATCDRSMGPAI